MAQTSRSQQRNCVLTVGLGLIAVLCTGMVRIVGESASPTNLVTNGGFENGVGGWLYEQWLGKRVPGFIDTKDQYEGRASFKMTEPGNAGGRYIAQQIKIGDGSQDYLLGFALKTVDMPEGDGYVRLGIEGHGWLSVENGEGDLVRVGGTQDWKHYEFPVSAAQLQGAKKATLFFYHDHLNQGVLGIDAVEFRPNPAPAAPTAAPDGKGK